MTDYALTLLRLDTLGAIKLDAIAVLSDPERTRDMVIEAREMVDAINAELDRRMAWASEVRATLLTRVDGGW